MRHYIFIILLQVCCHLYAQTEIKYNQLNGTKWETRSEIGLHRIYEFYDGYFICKSIYLQHDRSIEAKFNYYLSCDIPYSFLPPKRKKYKGKYLVVRSVLHENPLYNDIWYYTIMNFSDKEMILFKKAKELKEDEISLGGPPRDITLTLTRIEE